MVRRTIEYAATCIAVIVNLLVVVAQLIYPAEGERVAAAGQQTLLGHTQDIAVRIVADARLVRVGLVKAGGTQQLPAFGRDVNALDQPVEYVVLVVEAPTC